MKNNFNVHVINLLIILFPCQIIKNGTVKIDQTLNNHNFFNFLEESVIYFSYDNY